MPESGKEDTYPSLGVDDCHYAMCFISVGRGGIDDALDVTARPIFASTEFRRDRRAQIMLARIDGEGPFSGHLLVP
jgi:hypothetical protein